MEWRGGGKGVVKWKFHERGGEKIVGVVTLRETKV